LDELERETRRHHPSLFIMQANGGVVPVDHARRFPVGTIESGPAAGVLAACAVARELGIERAVSFDMGGTTVKTVLIEDGKAREKPAMEVGGDGLVPGSGYALRFPGFDLVEIGAGGGSIAWMDEGGALRVGPRSAGSFPAPACYGKGGTAPTVTDANVILGYMSPDALAGGNVSIDRAAAVNAFEMEIAPALGTTAAEAAYGVHRVANATMMRALRAVTTERGLDPRECALIAFGGAGPIHAARLAEEIGISQVVIPLHPGLFSALGLLLAESRFDYFQSVAARLEDLAAGRLPEQYEELVGRATEELQSAGLNADADSWQLLIDLNYERQSTQLTISLPKGPTAKDWPQIAAAKFHEEHERIYGYQRESDAIAVRNLRVRVAVQRGNVDLKRMGAAYLNEARNSNDPGRGVRNVYFGTDAPSLETQILSRASLVSEDALGPAIIEEFDTTVVVPPGWRASLDAYADIILEPV
jgi:N-methylhydantoinase A/oxoprolinase/acetone carboxylase beta subunit